MSGEIGGLLSPIRRFSGVGKLMLERASNATITISPDGIQTQRRPDCAVGQNSTSATIIRGTEHTLAVESPAFDELKLSTFMDQQITENNATAISLLSLACTPLTTATAPGGTLPYTGLTVNEDVQVVIYTDFGQEALTQVTAAPATANEFQVTAGNIVLDASQIDAGKSLAVTRNSDQTPAKYIGGPAAINSYGGSEFYGVISTLDTLDPWHIWYPNCSLSTDARSLGTGNDSLTTNYTAGIASGLGFNFPYMCWKLPFTGAIA